VLQDANDNAPEFPGPYEADVPVTANVGTVVQTVRATDADSVSPNRTIADCI